MRLALGPRGQRWLTAHGPSRQRRKTWLWPTCAMAHPSAIPAVGAAVGIAVGAAVGIAVCTHGLGACGSPGQLGTGMVGCGGVCVRLEG
jgi:hypothetical protein